MRIAYILSSDIAKYRGSTYKVENQVNAWRLLGNEVKIFAIVPSKNIPLIQAFTYLKKASSFKDFFSTNTELITDLNRYLPDIIYIRQSLPNSTFRKVQKEYKNVIEIVTDDREEYFHLFRQNKSVFNIIKVFLNKVYRKTFLSKANGLIYGTFELSKSSNFAVHKKRGTVLPNSVKLSTDEKDIIKQNIGSDTKIQLFFIGSPGFDWHGIDKIKRLSEKLGEEFVFHIVGLEGESSEHVKFYGYLVEDEYNQILKTCHICISTFALHRKNQYECTTIKFCEYLKKGFPVIVPYKETTLLQNGTPEWVLEVPNSEHVIDEPVVIEQIRQFCHTYKEFIVTHQMAEKYVASQIIEKKRLAFMQQIVDESKGGDINGQT